MFFSSSGIGTGRVKLFSWENCTHGHNMFFSTHQLLLYYAQMWLQLLADVVATISFKFAKKKKSKKSTTENLEFVRGSLNKELLSI